METWKRNSKWDTLVSQQKRISQQVLQIASHKMKQYLEYYSSTNQVKREIWRKV